MKNIKVILLGLAFIALSLSYPQGTIGLIEIGSILLLAVFILMPGLSLVINPLVNKLIESPKLDFIGSKGKSFVRFMFTIHPVKAKS